MTGLKKFECSARDSETWKTALKAAFMTEVHNQRLLAINDQ